MVYDSQTDNKTVKWSVNLDAIINNFPNIVGFNDDKSLQAYRGPSLFVNGSFTTDQLTKSGVFPEDKAAIKQFYQPLYPDCTVVIVEGAGHFVHIDKPAQVCSLIKEFLGRVDQP